MSASSVRQMLSALVFLVSLPMGSPLIAQGTTSQTTTLAREYQQAQALEKSQDYDRAFALYQKGAAAGYPDAQNALGYFYDNGLGVKKDPAMALRWWKRAATEHNHAVAQHNVGMWYFRYDGGVDKNLRLVEEWLRKSAKQGYLPAQFDLGKILVQGWDDESSRVLGLQLLEVVAQPGPDFQIIREDARKVLPQAIQVLQARGLVAPAPELKPFNTNLCQATTSEEALSAEYNFYHRSCLIRACLSANPDHQEQCEAATQ